MSDDDCEQLICQQDPFTELRKSLRPQKKSAQCPLTRSKLGFYSWSLMHTFAAYYPEQPNQIDKESMLGFLKGFKHLYPCKHCRKHFEKDYDRDPPSVQNRQELSLWVCRQHNYVNRILGKSQFDCSMQNLTKRWKTGCSNREESDQI